MSRPRTSWRWVHAWWFRVFGTLIALLALFLLFRR